MEGIKLYYSGTTKQYYCDEDSLQCTHCNGEIEEIMVLTVIYTSKGKLEELYCRNCWNNAKHNKKLGNIAEFKLVVIGDVMPDDCVPCLITKPRLQSSNKYDLFSAATDNMPCEKVIDRAWRSKDPNFMIDPNYKPFDMKILEKKDKPLSQLEFNQHLDILSNSTLCIEETKIKRLENANK